MITFTYNMKWCKSPLIQESGIEEEHDEDEIMIRKIKTVSVA